MVLRVCLKVLRDYYWYMYTSSVNRLPPEISIRRLLYTGRRPPRNRDGRRQSERAE